MRPSRRRTDHPRGLLIAAALVALAAGCGQEGEGSPSDVALEPALQGMFDGLEEEYGCGHGFYAGNAEQTHRLFIMAADPQATESELGIPGEVVLPDEQWHASVEIGEDLFANWCDDVVMADDPEPVIEESFEITGGTMTVVPDGPDGFTAELTDIEVRTADGSTVELGDLTTTNDRWGSYAG